MTAVNIAAVMAIPENQVFADRLHEVLDRDAMAEKMMEAAQDIKDVYQVIKRYVAVKFEDFKQALQDTIEFYAPPKLALADEDMEYVVGGGFWGSVGGWFKRNWKKLVIGAAVVAAVGISVATCGGASAGALAAIDVAALLLRDSKKSMRE